MDEKLTKDIQDFIEKEERTEEDIRSGAKLLFRLKGNKYFYQRVQLYPRRHESKVVYELRKFLKMRLAGKTALDVKRMMENDIPVVDATLAEGQPVKTDEKEEDLPDTDDAGKVIKRKGKRDDHDLLPDEIKQLWDGNAERYKKLSAVRASLAELDDPEPCDAFEYCEMCVDLHKKYLEDMHTYDSYVIETPVVDAPEATVEPEEQAPSEPEATVEPEEQTPSEPVKPKRKTTRKTKASDGEDQD